jgi:phospholipase/carboxylesterase
MRRVGLGLQPLGLVTGRGARDGVVFVPAGYRADRPTRLMVLLHGEASTPRAVIAPLRALADSAGIILLAPASRGRTWDAIGGGSIGPDVAFVDRAMAAAFARYNVDPGRVTVAGFSEGGSYALMLALANGDLFRRAIAFSPGSIPGALPPVGRPRMFVAHGTRDRVKRVANTRRFVVEELEQRGYDLRFLEFEGGHTIPPEIAETALEWLRVYGG